MQANYVCAVVNNNFSAEEGFQHVNVPCVLVN